ncbi:MAG: Indole-3-glycerol phosphate synthase [candidate division BRC1 bacterium ADurb.BinA364]|nr:MAG: Indole-3-glycerol phosphate synthase [candidate division BRC1 bacterium ADurb.BinA364]
MPQSLPNILERILARKRIEVAEAKARLPLEDVLRQASAAPPPRDFAAALRGCADMAVIAEVKKASPSKGIIRADFDPAAIARAYEAHGATAVSCLTDETFFQGSLDIFRSVRAAIDLPMLRKEFVIDEYQIHEARAAGADAVLLIVSILGDEELERFRGLIDSHGMAALVEAHSRKDAERAAQAGATLVGVNNRDLASPDFRTDVRHTEAILPFLPPNAIRVSESGIRHAADVDYLRGLGIDAILVGEQLMRQPDPGSAIDELLGRRPRASEDGADRKARNCDEIS